MSNISVPISASADDCYTDTTPAIGLAQFLSAGQPSAGLYRNAGMVFRAINIFPGSTILTAKITFTSFANLSDTTCNTRIYGHNTGLPVEFSTYDDFIARTLTTNYADWNNMSAWVTNTTYDSPDLTSIVQEIIDRPDWGYGQDMGFSWKDNSSSVSARRAAFSWDDDSTKAATLVVTFTPPPSASVSLSPSPSPPVLGGINFGFRVSKDGFDVKTATDDEMVVTSKLNSFKIPTTLQGSTTLFIPKNYGSATKVITHNLGYVPAYEAWFKDENDVWYTATSDPGVNLTPAHDIYAFAPASKAGTSTVSITLQNRNVTTDRTATIYYIIFIDKAI